MRMVYKKFKNLNYKTKLYVFYGISVLCIGYFMYDINIVASELSNNQFYIQNVGSDLISNSINTQFTYDYNLTVGGAIRKVAMDLIQIMFMIMFMLILYVHEVYNGDTK